jgi:hypothetical protein
MQFLEFPPKQNLFPIPSQFQENKSHDNLKYTKLEVVKQF